MQRCNFRGTWGSLTRKVKGPQNRSRNLKYASDYTCYTYCDGLLWVQYIEYWVCSCEVLTLRQTPNNAIIYFTSLLYEWSFCSNSISVSFKSIFLIALIRNTCFRLYKCLPGGFRIFSWEWCPRLLIFRAHLQTVSSDDSKNVCSVALHCIPLHGGKAGSDLLMVAWQCVQRRW